jgi:hypothetical protein
MSEETKDAMAQLKPRQQRFVMAMASSPSLKAAAEKVGVHASTADAWMKLPAVKEALADLLQRVSDETARRLQRESGQYLDVASKLVADDDREPAVRMRGALTLLQMGFDVALYRELERRVYQLERAIRAPGSGVQIRIWHLETPGNPIESASRSDMTDAVNTTMEDPDDE